MKVSVILPVYNEEDKIEGAIRRVEETMVKTGLDYEIIVVNDGSTIL
jgi:glycosyltransferase involved in cell wall biosynthesis